MKYLMMRFPRGIPKTLDGFFQGKIPNLKWMITRGTSILGNHHVSDDATITVYHCHQTVMIVTSRSSLWCSSLLSFLICVYSSFDYCLIFCCLMIVYDSSFCFPFFSFLSPRYFLGVVVAHRRSRRRYAVVTPPSPSSSPSKYIKNRSASS